MGWRRAVGCRARATVGLAVALLAGCDAEEGHPPRIADPGAQVAVVGEPLRVLVQATDPDGDALEFSFTAPMRRGIEETAELVTSPDGRVVFEWTPLAADLGEHVIQLVVTDGTYESSLPLVVEVRGQVEGSQPTFSAPLLEGIVHDLAVDGPCLRTLEIVVADPDDLELVLREEDPLLGGSRLDTTADGRTGWWDWCPSTAQQAASGVHELVLAADDGDNPPTLKRLSIFLERDGERCPCACEDDEGEKDDDLAEAFERGAVGEGTLTGRRLCPGNEDWVRIDLPERARVRARLSGSGSGSDGPDMSLELTDADEHPIALSVTAGTSNEAIDSECLEPGSYALRVLAPGTDHAGDYELSHVRDANGC